MNKPNIIFMISHDTGRYLGCYGHQVETPEIDKLAEKGIRFDQYYCPAPQCSPSRGSILTGLYPHNNGLIGLAHLGFAIKDEITTLPQAMQKAGYETALIGLSHETIGTPPPIEDRVFSSTYKLGYDRFEEVKGDRSPYVAKKAIEFLNEKSSNSSHQPFYLNIGFFETHRDFDEYEPYADNVEDVEAFAYLPDTPNVRKDISLLNGSAKVLDKAIGEIMECIHNSELSKNTIVIFTTDHGLAFPRAKGTFKDAGLETALLISGPEINGSQINQNLLCNIDLMPTLLELAGAPIPKELDGRSFAALIKGEKKEIRDEFFCELTWHDRYHPMRGIRTNQYKYVKNFADGPNIYMPFDAHKSLSGQEVRKEYYVPNVPEELYDLEKDPLEKNNIINEASYSLIAEELRKKVENWMIQTKDPLLKGPVLGVGSKRWEEELRNNNAYPGKEHFLK
ncbi:sulfatase [Niallia sp. NCCP-28]|uniref:sulfatase family protein n=1 Tax=Niallia sp. NCCP-28 TaxID=2934712 RepID=UPI00208C5B94|nr:sulfatase [Niallia sp. NCCP-28]GKU84718.1 putative sulfatase [Niallia sp. NCCP-28]